MLHAMIKHEKYYKPSSLGFQRALNRDESVQFLTMFGKVALLQSPVFPTNPFPCGVSAMLAACVSPARPEFGQHVHCAVR